MKSHALSLEVSEAYFYDARPRQVRRCAAADRPVHRRRFLGARLLCQRQDEEPRSGDDREREPAGPEGAEPALRDRAGAGPCRS